MNQLCVPIPAASNTQQILDEVFSMCRIPWIYDFIFYGDPAADISMLLAPVQKRHGLAARIYVNATETSSKYAHTFDFNKELVFYSLPAFSVGPITAGFCVEQPVSRTIIPPVDDEPPDPPSNCQPSVSIQQLDSSAPAQAKGSNLSTRKHQQQPVIVPASTTTAASPDRRKNKQKHKTKSKLDQKGYHQRNKKSSKSSSSSSNDMLQCIRFVRHDDNGVFFHVTENHLTGVTQVDCLTLHSSTRLKRVRMKFDLHSLRSVLRTPAGILHPPDIASSLIYLHVSHERRLCPVCEGRIASSECNCTLPLQRPAHPLDFRFEASNMRLYTGFYQGATVVRLCSAGHCVINATLQSGSVIQGEVNHSLVDKLHRLAVKDRIARLQQKTPRQPDLSVSNLIKEAQQIVNDLEQHARTYDRESDQTDEQQGHDTIDQVDRMFNSNEDIKFERDSDKDTPSDENAYVGASNSEQPDSTVPYTTGHVEHDKEELSVIPAASAAASSPRDKTFHVHMQQSIPMLTAPTSASFSNTRPSAGTPSSFSLHLRRPSRLPVLTLSEHDNESDTINASTSADGLPALTENVNGGVNGRLVLTGREPDVAEIGSLDLDDVDGLMDAKDVLGEMDKEELMNNDREDNHMSPPSGLATNNAGPLSTQFPWLGDVHTIANSQSHPRHASKPTPKRSRIQSPTSPIAQHDHDIGMNDDDQDDDDDDDEDLDMDEDMKATGHTDSKTSQQQRKRKRNGYEGLTEEQKMEIRRKRNREAAARSNLKRKRRNESVRRDLACLTQKAVRLRVKEMMLRDENTRLRNALKAANISTTTQCNNNNKIISP